MEQSLEEPSVVRNEDKSRFEIYAGDELAGFVQYRTDGQVIELVHTEVGPRFQGEGLAGKLARASLDAARAANLAVLPYCPYINRWLIRHPDYADLVPADERARFGL
ncbi:MAG: N-acetyltransferase [Streptosporangiaceae bacterium]|nr:N-acetyltransferase [Streptosporangiaceae bacterium]MBV9853905.1 N-acetyltransferase [Streptosporangiaceae bacterium]